jgi:Ca2+-binding RTX toxin-like protein
MATVNGNGLPNVLFGTAAVDTISGLGGNDTLWGRAGNDRLIGGVGADSMRGETGNDKYYVDHGGDEVTELAGGGTDIVFSSISFNMSIGGRVHVEDLTLTGAALNGTGNALRNVLTGNASGNTLSGLAGIDRLLGLGGNDTLLGGTGNDVLLGGVGNDILNGDAGADNMRGEAGSDTYYVDNAGDVVTELAGGGVDTMHSSVSQSTLNAGGKLNVENLTLVGTAVTGTGNALNNTITGNNGVNQLTGLGGNDTVRGLAGIDVLYGGTGNDRLEGGSGRDHLFGEDGDDTLVAGPDGAFLTGGTGQDWFVFDQPPPSGIGSPNTILDFIAAEDTIALARTVYSALPLGALAPGSFRVLTPAELAQGNAVLEADDRILHIVDPAPSTPGSYVLYDPDGNGAAVFSVITLFIGDATLSAADFSAI